MLRLFIHFKGQLLRVRLAAADEKFLHPCRWQGVEFEITPSNDFTMIWTTLLPELSREDGLALLNLVGARYPFSPNYHSLKEACSDVVFQNLGDEWVFFGGSFNPWHSGHQACLDLIDHAETCLVIPDRNPLKELREIDPITTVLELSSRIRFRKNQFFVPSFLLNHKKNPTVEWIEILKKELPRHRFSLLMGFDSFAAIDKWTRVADLLPLLDTIYVASRLESEAEAEKTKAMVKTMAPWLNIVFLGHHAFEEVSSTALRKKS